MNARDKEIWNDAAKATKGESWDEQVAFMQRFADLIRADEREACAKVCEDMQSGWPSDDHLACAAGIRARGNT